MVGTVLGATGMNGLKKIWRVYIIWQPVTEDRGEGKALPSAVLARIV